MPSESLNTLHIYIYIFNYIYIYLPWISECVDIYIHSHIHTSTHMSHASHLIAHIIHLVPVFWQGIGTSVVELGPLRLPGTSQQTKSSTFLPHSGLLGLLNTLQAFWVTSWNAGFLPPSKILNKMELVNCAYGNKSPFQHFSWHSNAFLNIIKRSFSTWIHLLQATLYFCKSKFQQVWFHFFYSILFALTKRKISTATATLRSPLIAWVGIIFYWLTV